MATITQQSWSGSGAIIKLGEHTHQKASVQSGPGPIFPPQTVLVGVQIVFSASLHVEPNVCVCVFDNCPHLLPS